MKLRDSVLEIVLAAVLIILLAGVLPSCVSEPEIQGPPPPPEITDVDGHHYRLYLPQRTNDGVVWAELWERTDQPDFRYWTRTLSSRLDTNSVPKLVPILP